MRSSRPSVKTMTASTASARSVGSPSASRYVISASASSRRIAASSSSRQPPSGVSGTCFPLDPLVVEFLLVSQLLPDLMNPLTLGSHQQRHPQVLREPVGRPLPVLRPRAVHVTVKIRGADLLDVMVHSEGNVVETERVVVGMVVGEDARVLHLLPLLRRELDRILVAAFRQEHVPVGVQPEHILERRVMLLVLIGAQRALRLLLQRRQAG